MFFFKWSPTQIFSSFVRTGLKATAAGLRLQAVLATLEARFTQVDEQLRLRRTGIPAIFVS
jgi:hypothetical protein